MLLNSNFRKLALAAQLAEVVLAIQRQPSLTRLRAFVLVIFLEFSLGTISSTTSIASVIDVICQNSF